VGQQSGSQAGGCASRAIGWSVNCVGQQGRRPRSQKGRQAIIRHTVAPASPGHAAAPAPVSAAGRSRAASAARISLHAASACQGFSAAIHQRPPPRGSRALSSTASSCCATKALRAGRVCKGGWRQGVVICGKAAATGGTAWSHESMQLGHSQDAAQVQCPHHVRPTHQGCTQQPASHLVNTTAKHDPASPGTRSPASLKTAPVPVTPPYLSQPATPEHCTHIQASPPPHPPPPHTLTCGPQSSSCPRPAPTRWPGARTATAARWAPGAGPRQTPAGHGTRRHPCAAQGGGGGAGAGVSGAA
jgi:hypothetical protein